MGIVDSIPEALEVHLTSECVPPWLRRSICGHNSRMMSTSQR